MVTEESGEESMDTHLPTVRRSTSVVAPPGARGPVVHRRNSAMRQLVRTARSAAELVLVAADAVADRVLEAIGSRR
jgi:hypothetical protein